MNASTSCSCSPATSIDRLLSSSLPNEIQEILQRLFDPTQDENEQGTPVYGLFNGDGMVPAPFAGQTFTGTETHYNFTIGSGFSAHEGSGYDVTDSFHNAADIGTVAYRDDKQVIGTVGYSSGWNRDRNDYFSFYAGKTGTFADLFANAKKLR